MLQNNHFPYSNQISLDYVSDNKARIYLCGSLKLVELDFNTSTFICIKRTDKNIFRMLNGLNEKLIRSGEFKFIIIPFNSTKLKTTREKWLMKGIRYPFINGVDQQIILPFNEINFESVVSIRAIVERPQLSLFQGGQL